MPKKKTKHKQFIGRRERVDFPELGLFNLEGKIDTGAYTSTLHCNEIYVRDHVLHFVTEDANKAPVTCQAPYFSQKQIKNSFGETETRYIINVKIKIGERIIKCLISLTNRGQMRYPVLIGRRILKNKFVVDVSQLNIAGQQLFLTN